MAAIRLPPVLKRRPLWVLALCALVLALAMIACPVLSKDPRVREVEQWLQEVERLMNRAAAPEEWASRLTPDARVEARVTGYPRLRIQGPEAILAHLEAIQKTFPQLRIDWADPRIHLLESARAGVHVTLVYRSQKGEPAEPQELRLLLRREEEGWLLEEVKTVPTFGRQE
jgi:hypothetical protein